MAAVPSTSAADGGRAVREVAWAALAGGVPLLVYLRTMAPTVYGLDSAELTTGAYALGIVHAPGCPTYMLLGHLFSRLPLGDVGYRLNLLSAVAAALAALFLYRVLVRLTGERAVALTATWFAAFTYYFWVSALAAELYALHAAFVAGLLLLVLRWREEARPAQLMLLALLFGIGAGNHLSIVLLLPGFAWLVVSGRRTPWRPAWLPLAVTACGIAGAAIYLYLPLRYASDTPLNYARNDWHVDLTTAQGLRWMVTVRMFESFLFAVPAADLPHEMGVYAARLWSNFVGLGVLLGAVGLAADFRRRPSLHVGLGLLFAGHLAFYLTYRVGDKEVMLLPTYLVWSVWVALGAQVVCRGLGRMLPRGWSFSAPVLLLLLALGCLVVNFERVDVSGDWSARQRGEAILASLEPGAVYLGTWADVPILEYLQIVEHRRPDVRTVQLLFRPERDGRIADDMLSAGRAVYTSAPSFLDGSDLVADREDGCGCFRVRRPGPPAGEPEATLTDARALP